MLIIISVSLAIDSKLLQITSSQKKKLCHLLMVFIVKIKPVVSWSAQREQLTEAYCILLTVSVRGSCFFFQNSLSELDV